MTNKQKAQARQVAQKLGTPGLHGRFTQADSVGKQRIIAANFGEAGTLKTSFWLTAPGPILIQSTDNGTEGVVDVYLKQREKDGLPEKEIFVKDYDPNTYELAEVSDDSDRIALAEKLATELEEDFDFALENGIRTIVWDKEDQIYGILKYAEFGAPSDSPQNYYALFERYRSFYNKIKASDVNFGVIQGMKNRWGAEMKQSGKIGAKKTDNRVRRGMPEVDELVHVNIEHVLEKDGDDSTYIMRVGKSRGPGGRDIQNTEMPYKTFPEFAALYFPDSEEGDWE